MSDTQFTIPLSFASHDGKTQINAKIWTDKRFGIPDAAASSSEASEPPVPASQETAPSAPATQQSALNDATTNPKAIIQIVHGMAEYIDRYDDLAKYLVSNGYIVCAEDHIGHGKSAANPQEYGHMPAHGGADVLVRDAHTLYRMVHELYPDTPYILYGHSMGSFITRVYISRYGTELAAAILSGTGHPAPGLSKMGRGLARFLASVRGETYRSKFIDNMGAGAYGKQIENARTPLDWLSTDPALVDAYIADEQCGFMFTVGGYASLLDLATEMVTPECAAQVPKDLPILLVAGDGDPVGEFGEGVQRAADLFRGAGIQQVDVKLYPGMRHEIHNEVDKDSVYQDITTWLAQAPLRHP